MEHLHSEMACDSPYYVEVHWQPEKIPAPCGKCPPCQKRRVSQWNFRLQQHEKNSECSLFITLTYDTRFVPITAKGFMSLSKRDYQLFMKRLRKIAPNVPKISYYACGEYGSNTYRPHYHAIIFNASEVDIEKAWGLGEVHTGRVTGASIGYTLKYINKGKRIPLHANDDRIPEFSLMSKGMGANYMTPQMVKYHKTDLSRAYVTNPDGHKIALPRYYKQKMLSDDEQKQQALICKRLSEEATERSRRDYINLTGSAEGFEDQIESGQRQRYKSHRAQGLKNRKL